MARALSESANFAEAAPRIIQAICENLGWTTGAVWNFDRHAQLLRCQEFWHVPHHPVPEFEAITRAMTVPPGTKLAGQAWSTGQAVWVTDVSQDPFLPPRPGRGRRGDYTCGIGHAHPVGKCGPRRPGI